MKIDLAKCYVEPYDIDYGMTVYVARSRQVSSPVGLVWGLRTSPDRRSYGDDGIPTFEVCGSYVPEWARRQGVRTLINKWIHKHFETIRTQSASEFGRKFLRAAGYKRDPLGGYFLKRPARGKRGAA